MAVSTRSAVEERALLHGISWETYEALLRDYENSSAPRLTYDRGTVEIMSPLPEHDSYSRFMDLLLELWAYDTNTRIRVTGSTTFGRRNIRRGFEPDSSFYIQNAPRISGRERIDLDVDPPPDLIVEIEITHPSLEKLPIYAELGVPEVWRYHDGKLEMLVLRGEEYVEAERSDALPAFTPVSLSALLRDVPKQDAATWMQRALEWVRSLPK